MVEYVQKDDVKIMSLVIGGVWTTSKYVWMGPLRQISGSPAVGYAGDPCSIPGQCNIQ